jgi:hypothetical protein
MSAADLRELARAVVAIVGAEKAGSWCQHAARRLVALLARGIAGVNGTIVWARVPPHAVVAVQTGARCIVSVAAGPLLVKAALAHAVSSDGAHAVLLVTLCAYLDAHGTDVACAAPCSPDALLHYGIITQEEYKTMREALRERGTGAAPREI